MEEIASDYFTVNSHEIRDFRVDRIRPYDDVYRFRNLYFTYGQVESFISFLIKDRYCSAEKLLNLMGTKERKEFLINSFNQVNNNFTELIQFEEVERS